MDGRILGCAGAGTGKTTMLMGRIQHMLHQQVGKHLLVLWPHLFHHLFTVRGTITS